MSVFQWWYRKVLYSAPPLQYLRFGASHPPRPPQDPPQDILRALPSSSSSSAGNHSHAQVVRVLCLDNLFLVDNLWISVISGLLLLCVCVGGGGGGMCVCVRVCVGEGGWWGRLAGWLGGRMVGRACA